MRGGVLMHAYLKTIGFSKIKTTKELQEILRDVVENYDRKKIVETEEHHLFAEFSKEYAYDCGITVCGEIDVNNRFQMEYYYPYFEGGQISSYEEVSVERHVDKESFAGACDDMRLGITMIFYLTHAAEYLEMKQKNALQPLPLPLSVSGLAAEGKILLPIQKDPEQVEKERRSTQQKNSLISAARNGDEDAMESLTMDDIDTYAMISQRLTKEDVFSIVFISVISPITLYWSHSRPLGMKKLSTIEKTSSFVRRWEIMAYVSISSMVRLSIASSSPFLSAEISEFF